MGDDEDKKNPFYNAVDNFTIISITVVGLLIIGYIKLRR